MNNDLISNWHSEDINQEDFNPYLNPKLAQKRCSHKWQDNTSALYTDIFGNCICAICKKKIGGDSVWKI